MHHRAHQPVTLFTLCAGLALSGCTTEDEPSVFGTASDGITAGSASTGTTGITTTGGSQGTDGGPDTSDPSSSGGSATTGGDSDSDSDSGGTGPKFDTPDGMTGGGPDTGAGEGCEKVDFLFVLDNSISMGDEQNNLANSFPSFINTIQTEVQAQDYNIMVIDTDEWDKWGEKWDKCHNKCLTDDPGDSCLTIYFDDIICGMEPPEPPACDQTLGAGRAQGAGGPPVDCGIDGGARYMTEDQTDLPGTFQCVAEMGATGNSNERPMDAMRAALGPQTQAGGCHPGFLRDDAILVVTFISDEEETGSAGTPQQWHDDLLAFKNGNETAVVTLALSGDTDTPGQECIETPKMTQFIDLFGARGFIGSICEPDYGPFFQQAVGVIDYACDEFVPEG